MEMEVLSTKTIYITSVLFTNERTKISFSSGECECLVYVVHMKAAFKCQGEWADCKRMTPRTNAIDVP